MIRTRRPRIGRAVAVATGALVLVLALAGSALGAERATLRMLGSSPIYAGTVNVHKAGGGSVAVRPARYHYRVTAGGVTTDASGNCVDLSHYIVTGRDYQVDLQSAADAPELASADFLAAGWLLSQTDDLIGAAANPGLEAGALQTAIWQLTGQARGLDAPTDDITLNTRVNALRAMAAGRRVPSDLALTVSGGDTCIDRRASVTVTGTPGALVDLSVTAGAGTVSPAQVTIDETGAAVAQLSAASPGDVTVSGTTSAPTLLRATKPAGQTSPQDQLFLRPGVLTSQATGRFIDCDVFELSPGGPVTSPLFPIVAPSPQQPPAAPITPAAPALAITMASPRLAAPGGLAVYRIRVSNSGTRTVRGARVAQRLGHGVAAVAARGPKGTSVRIARSAAAWKLGALRPGRSATLTLKVRVGRSLAGGIAHSSASLRSARTTAKATGTTSIVRRVGKTEQGF